MTTQAAARAYLSDHMSQWGDRGYVVYNPFGKPIDDLPFILGWNNGGSPGLLIACLLSEDGEALGSHCCSDEGYMPHDLGVLEGSRPDRHEHFKAHYPGGYRMDFVRHDDPRLEAAYQRHIARKGDDQPTPEPGPCQ